MQEQKVAYTEYQKFNQKLLWMGIVGLMTIPILLALFIKKGVLISILIAVPVIILLLLLRLKTSINSDGISVKFFPIILADRHIPWDQISSVQIRKYKPISEYGGWGLRITFKHGIAYTVKGNKGIQLELKDGRKLLIGTQKPYEAQVAIAQFMSCEGLYSEKY